MPMTYSLTEAADELGVSRGWLQKFLRAQPVDTDGVPFYFPVGNRKKFTERDLERLIETIRDRERQRLESSRQFAPIVPTVRKESVEEFGRVLSGRLTGRLRSE